MTLPIAAAGVGVLSGGHIGGRVDFTPWQKNRQTDFGCSPMSWSSLFMHLDPKSPMGKVL